MNSNYVQTKLRRDTRERLRNYAAVILASGREEAINRATGELTVDQLVNRLLDQWEKHRARGHKSRLKTKTE